MMKKTLLFFSFSLFSLALAGQLKHDYNWVFGYPNSNDPTFPGYGGSLVNFSDSIPQVSWFDIKFDLKANAVISDAEGHLLFYSNGCEVMNWAHQLVENGDSINPGYIHDEFCDTGYPASQGILALPWPGDSTRYCLLHVWTDSTYYYTKFLFTQLEFLSPSDSGRVIKKNQLIHGGSFTDLLTAVRHANGRDWWVALPERFSDRIFIYLLDPTGIKLTHTITIGQVWTGEPVGQSVFSPDGTRYARVSALNGINLYDFDRCSGLLSNHRFMDISQDTVYLSTPTGLSFSPNNRFLYATVGYKLWQYDTWAADIAASRQLVAYWDGYLELGVLPTSFFQHMLAPNGKIYIVPPGSSSYLHVIHSPNEPGLACHVEQRAVKLPAYEWWGMPNMPYYNLYDVPGSPCDTLGIDDPLTATQEPAGPGSNPAILYPNPTTSLLQVDFPAATTGTLRLLSISGVELRSWQVKECLQATLHLDELPAGLYLLQVPTTEGALEVHKVVIER
ncbi:MAG: hypothetical protein Kow0027_20980 [Saprospiraceae bacterium]